VLPDREIEAEGMKERPHVLWPEIEFQVTARMRLRDFVRALLTPLAARSTPRYR